METKKFDDGFSVCGQVRRSDFPLIHALGFQAIICNRPDDEEPDQPRFAEIETAAHLAGLQAAHLPVAMSGPTAEDVDRLRGAMRTLPKPILAYCRSGNRSEAVWRACLGR